MLASMTCAQMVYACASVLSFTCSYADLSYNEFSRTYLMGTVTLPNNTVVNNRRNLMEEVGDHTP